MEVFDTIMERYQSARHAHLASKSDDVALLLSRYPALILRYDGERITVNIRPSHLPYHPPKVTDADFICDVEIAARSVLSFEDFRFFRVFHLEGRTSAHAGSPAYKIRNERIIHAVTAECLSCGLRPTKYFNEPEKLVLPQGTWVPERKIGRPRKHPSNAARQAAYHARLRESTLLRNS